MSAINPLPQAPPPAETTPEGAGLIELIGSRLRAHPYLILRGITCEYHDGVLVLRGRVPSYYLKQIAQSLAARADGVERIDNQIEVDRQGRGRRSPSSGRDLR